MEPNDYLALDDGRMECIVNTCIVLVVRNSTTFTNTGRQRADRSRHTFWSFLFSGAFARTTSAEEQRSEKTPGWKNL